MGPCEPRGPRPLAHGCDWRGKHGGLPGEGAPRSHSSPPRDPRDATRAASRFSASRGRPRQPGLRPGAARSILCSCARMGRGGGVKVNLPLPRSAQHARKSSRESSHCHGHNDHYARDVSGFAGACRATCLVKGPHFVLPSSGRVAELRARLRTSRLRGPMHVRVGVPAPLSPQ